MIFFTYHPTPSEYRYILFQLLIFTLPIFHLFLSSLTCAAHLPQPYFYLEEHGFDFFVPVGAAVSTCSYSNNILTVPYSFISLLIIHRHCNCSPVLRGFNCFSAVSALLFCISCSCNIKAVCLLWILRFVKPMQFVLCSSILFPSQAPVLPFRSFFPNYNIKMILMSTFLSPFSSCLFKLNRTSFHGYPLIHLRISVFPTLNQAF